MTTNEFSDQWDILAQKLQSEGTLVGNYGMPRNFIAFNEYEKSIYLTRAQEQFVISMCRQPDIVDNDNIRSAISNIICENTIVPNVVINNKPIKRYEIDLPNDILVTLNEGVYDLENNLMKVNNVSFFELNSILQNPFRRPDGHKVIRIDAQGKIILHSAKDIYVYCIMYARKPKPIILEDFDSDLSINGFSNRTESELNSSVHYDILNMAVKMAYMDRMSGGEQQQDNRQNREQ